MSKNLPQGCQEKKNKKYNKRNLAHFNRVISVAFKLIFLSEFVSVFSAGSCIDIQYPVFKSRLTLLLPVTQFDRFLSARTIFLLIASTTLVLVEGRCSCFIDRLGR